MDINAIKNYLENLEKIHSKKFKDNKDYLESCKANKNLSPNDYKINPNHKLDEYFDKYGNKLENGKLLAYKKDELWMMDKNTKYWEIDNDSEFKYFEVPSKEVRSVNKGLFIGCLAATLIVGGIVGGVIGYFLNNGTNVIAGDSYPTYDVKLKILCNDPTYPDNGKIIKIKDIRYNTKFDYTMAVPDDTVFIGHPRLFVGHLGIDVLETASPVASITEAKNSLSFSLSEENSNHLVTHLDFSCVNQDIAVARQMTLYFNILQGPLCIINSNCEQIDVSGAVDNSYLKTVKLPLVGDITYFNYAGVTSDVDVKCTITDAAYSTQQSETGHEYFDNNNAFEFTYYDIMDPIEYTNLNFYNDSSDLVDTGFPATSAPRIRSATFTLHYNKVEELIENDVGYISIRCTQKDVERQD